MQWCIEFSREWHLTIDITAIGRSFDWEKERKKERKIDFDSIDLSLHLIWYWDRRKKNISPLLRKQWNSNKFFFGYFSLGFSLKSSERHRWFSGQTIRKLTHRLKTEKKTSFSLQKFSFEFRFFVSTFVVEFDFWKHLFIEKLWNSFAFDYRWRCESKRNKIFLTFLLFLFFQLKNSDVHRELKNVTFFFFFLKTQIFFFLRLNRTTKLLSIIFPMSMMISVEHCRFFLDQIDTNVRTFIFNSIRKNIFRRCLRVRFAFVVFFLFWSSTSKIRFRLALKSVDEIVEKSQKTFLIGLTSKTISVRRRRKRNRKFSLEKRFFSFSRVNVVRWKKNKTKFCFLMIEPVCCTSTVYCWATLVDENKTEKFTN